MTDTVNHPPHYQQHPAGIECIDVIEPMTFNVGSAMKYLWRAGLKGDLLEDLLKAHWYVVREIGRLKRGQVQDELRKQLQEHLEYIQTSAAETAGVPAEPEAAVPVVDVRSDPDPGGKRRGRAW
jgi:hypothetical protein